MLEIIPSALYVILDIRYLLQLHAQLYAETASCIVHKVAMMAI